MVEEFRFFPKVGEIAHKGVVQLHSSATVGELVALMGENNLSNIVFSHDGRYSVFSVDDLLNFRRQRRDMATRLEELRAHDLECVDENENVLSLLHRFDETDSRYLGVQDAAGNLVGIVSYTDVLDSVDPSVMMERRTLADLLNTRAIEHVPGSVPTEEVLHYLNRAEDAVLVTEQGRMVGILTTKDVVRIINNNLDTSAPVRDYMTSPVHTISKMETVKGAITYLKERKFKRAIVMDEETGRVIGIVSQRDLINSTYGRWADLMKLHAHELDELIQVLESKNQRLLHETLTDPLTGVGNRRKINQCLEAEVGRYYRHEGISISLLMLDLDHFKSINDAKGHAFGDDVLRHLCQTIALQLRVSDNFARWGGEEFIALLPGTPKEAATELAHRLCKIVEKSPFTTQTITISIGVAEYQQGESIENFISRADSALYQAKSSGRNRAVCAD